MRFRVELWRVIKFILITLAVNLPLMLINGAVVNVLAGSRMPGVGTWLTVVSYIHLFLSTGILTLLHRYFTFRATEKWFIALPIMLVAAFGWQFFSSLALSLLTVYDAALAQDDFAAFVNLRNLLWPVLSYLLQRYVIYCHTTDTNRWYQKHHLTNEEEGV